MGSPNSSSARPRLSYAPIWLRLALGVTFIWAGLGKLATTSTFSPADAAALANLGIIAPAPAAPAGTPASPTPAAPDRPIPKPQSSAPGGPLTLAQAPAAAHPSPSVTAAIPSSTAADFPQGAQVASMWRLALVVHRASRPADDTPPPRRAILPRILGEAPWPKALALALVAAELGGGICVLIGLLTRLSALALAGVMLGAMWLTQIGPNAMNGTAALGFLPPYPAFDTDAWRPLLWQFALFCSAMALAFSGAGALSIDRMLTAFRAPSPAPAPRPAKPKPGGDE